MGLFFVKNKPKIKVETKKKDNYSGWLRCSDCEEMIHVKELQGNFNCCPKCDYHYRLSVEKRIELLCDEESFSEILENMQSEDPLSFVDSISYKERIAQAKEKSKKKEACVIGTAKINDKDIALGILDFSFMGGSMGSVVGEKITYLIEHSIKNKLPLVIVSASGGARMQESILSLMQMAKTSAALSKLHQKKLPYVSILTNPTTGGVTASFASLGDVIIAEPKALIAFAGPRVVEQTIGQKLPEGAQKSEFLLEKGMIDSIVKRKDLKKELSLILSYLTENMQREKSKKLLKDLVKKNSKKAALNDKK